MTNTHDPLAVEFLHYNRWANLKLIDFCRDLPREVLDSSTPGTYGSIYATLKHIIRSEAGYYQTLSGTRLAPPFAWDDDPPLPMIRPYAEQIASALIEGAGQMQPTDAVQREWQGQSFRFKALTLLIQAVNHGVEHRTNITTTLAQHNLQPPNLDGWTYMISNPDRLGA